jgi:hypothetical protein
MPTTKSKILHYIVTRHAVTQGGRIPSPDWIEKRRSYLTGICGESLRNQSCQDFIWLILVDPRLLESEKTFLGSTFHADFPVEFLATHSGDLDDLSTLLAKYFGAIDCEYLVTTRIDSDDSIAASLVFKIQDSVGKFETPFILDPVHGYVIDLDIGIPLKRVYRHSPFQSLVETPTSQSPIQTVFYDQHLDLSKSFPYHVLPCSSPSWCMTVHGKNLGNRPIGLPVSTRHIPTEFVALYSLPKSTLISRLIYGLHIVFNFCVYVAVEGRYRMRIVKWLRHLGVLE